MVFNAHRTVVDFQRDDSIAIPPDAKALEQFMSQTQPFKALVLDFEDPVSEMLKVDAAAVQTFCGQIQHLTVQGQVPLPVLQLLCSKSLPTSLICKRIAFETGSLASLRTCLPLSVKEL